MIDITNQCEAELFSVIANTVSLHDEFLYCSTLEEVITFCKLNFVYTDEQFEYLTEDINF